MGGAIGLGGNVEEVGILSNSRIHVKLTRGMFSLIGRMPTRQATTSQNNGVTPDYPYAHTVSDFRAGYVNYVKRVDEKAVVEAGK